MEKPEGPIIDMTPEGEFVTPPKPGYGLILRRVAILGLSFFVFVLLIKIAVKILPLLFLLIIAWILLARFIIRRP